MAEIRFALRTLVATTSLLVCASGETVPTPAHAAGGTGGAGCACYPGTVFGNGGVGGTGYSGMAGAAGESASIYGGGGGGGGAGGGAGGVGGISGNTGILNGVAGGAGGVNGNGAGAASVDNSTTISGADGQAGQSSIYPVGAGGGGAGGYGAIVTGAGVNSNSGAILGGKGGNGGASGYAGGGSAGDGGVGFFFAAPGAALTNSGSIVGGAGGVGGVHGGSGVDGANGAGGVGVEGSGLSIVNSGSITGGLGGDGATRAEAVLFTGGVNSFTMTSTSNVVGNVVAYSAADTLGLVVADHSTFDLTQLGAVNSTAQYQGFGIFQKAGAGALVLTGAPGSALSYRISAGALEVDAPTSLAGAVAVDGGMLTGTGSVGGVSVASGAIFSPGAIGSPGTVMNVGGNLSFAPGSTYAVYLNPTTSTAADVSGSATLAGTVQANFASAAYVSKTYTILTAANGVSGSFSGVQNVGLPANTTDTLGYGADAVYLNLTAAFTNYTGLTGNQQSVADTLTNYFNVNGGIPGVFFGLSQAALSQIDGQGATGAEHGGLQLGTGFMNAMLDPFGRFDATQPSSTPTQAEFRQEAMDLVSATPPTGPDASTPARRAPLWTAWASGYGGGASFAGNASTGSNSVSSSIYGFAAGADYRATPDAVFGFALGGGGANWSLSDASGNGRSQALQLGVYGMTRSGPLYVSSALAFSNSWFTTDRNALGDALQGKFTGQDYGARFESGYRLAVTPALGVSPYAAVQAQEFQTPAYSETYASGGGLGTFGLSYKAMSSTDVRTELGARVDATTSLAGMALVLHGKLGWAHDFVSNPTLNAAFQSLPGTEFTVAGAPIAHNAALVSGGAEVFLTRHLSFEAKFDGEFAGGSHVYGGTGTLRYTW